MGEGIPADTAQAIYWIKKAADKNLTAAKYNYGIMLINGIGVSWNPFSAFNILKVRLVRAWYRHNMWSVFFIQITGSKKKLEPGILLDKKIGGW